MEATTNELVLHEVCYVLASKKRYALSATGIAAYLTSLLCMPGLTFGRGQKRRYRRALEIYVANPRHEFADSLIAAQCQAPGVELATFDEDLAELPPITRWR